MSDPTTPVAGEDGGGRPVDEAIAQELVERARAEGVELVGPGGLLTGLTKTVLETALGVAKLVGSDALRAGADMLGRSSLALQ